MAANDGRVPVIDHLSGWHLSTTTRGPYTTYIALASTNLKDRWPRWSWTCARKHKRSQTRAAIIIAMLMRRRDRRHQGCLLLLQLDGHLLSKWIQCKVHIYIGKQFLYIVAVVVVVTAPISYHTTYIHSTTYTTWPHVNFDMLAILWCFEPWSYILIYLRC